MADEQASELPGTVSISTLATLIGMHPKNAQKLVNAGILVRTTRGRYLLVPSMQAYCEHLRTQAAGRVGVKGKTDIDVIEEGALLKRAHRKMVELKQQQLEGSMISITELMDIWGDIIRTNRALVQAWTERCAFELPDLTDHHKKVMKRVAGELLCGFRRMPATCSEMMSAAVPI